MTNYPCEAMTNYSEFFEVLVSNLFLRDFAFFKIVIDKLSVAGNAQLFVRIDINFGANDINFGKRQFPCCYVKISKQD